MLILIIVIVLAIVIVGVMAIVKSVRPQTRGKRGENIVTHIIDGLNGTVFNSYVIVDENGKSHQIDHIYVGAEGVFVIETKNYSGDIYGSAEQYEWTQVLAGGQVKNKFYNPVKQNATHVYYIKNLLPKNIWVNSCVVFVKCNIKYINADNVFTPNGLIAYISQAQHPLSDKEVKMVVETLNRNATDISEKEHIQSIRYAQAQIANNICPRCNAPLVLRNGKYGQFYGCSNYPKCKFTKRI